ncbi:MAG: ribonuclease HI family protein [Patescibacteria group bacterium]|nr:ribonuclease HI family protein [Patescibacteria group bacterium]
MQKIIVYTDGASRGNPGPASIGVAVHDNKGSILKKYSQTIGETTNNDAEYQAVVFALKKMKILFGKKNVKKYEILVRSDSQLLVSQLTGKYKLKDANIQKLFIQIWNLKTDYSKVDFEHIPREQNKLADELANEALDADCSNSKLL